MIVYGALLEFELRILLIISRQDRTFWSCFHKRKSTLQVWNDTRRSKWGQSFHFLA